MRSLHAVWRMLPRRARRRLLARGAAVLAPRPDQPPPAVPARGVVVAGELGRASGLGQGARLMLAGLEALGVEGWALHAGLEAPSGTAAMPPAGWPIVFHVNSPLLPAALLRLDRRLTRGRRIIGYWAWELPTVPPDWRAGVPFVHEIWAPSRFTAAALEPLLPGRIRVVPHPVACDPPVASALTRADFGLPEGAVVVLVSFSLASSFERKNPLSAIAAFRAAFGDRADRILLLKLGNPDHAPADFARLRQTVAGAPNIRLETRTLPPADSHALTRCADIVLSLHRSEGFGLVPAEAMFLQRAIIATDWSGTTDFLDAGCAMPIACKLIPARDPRGVFEAPGAVWADADIGEAVAALRALADDAPRRAELGAAARSVAMARLGPSGLDAALRGIGLPA